MKECPNCNNDDDALFIPRVKVEFCICCGKTVKRVAVSELIYDFV